MKKLGRPRRGAGRERSLLSCGNRAAPWSRPYQGQANNRCLEVGTGWAWSGCVRRLRSSGSSSDDDEDDHAHEVLKLEFQAAFGSGVLNPCDLAKSTQKHNPTPTSVCHDEDLCAAWPAVTGRWVGPYTVQCRIALGATSLF